MSTEILDFTSEDGFDFSPTEVVFSATGAALAKVQTPGTGTQFLTNDTGFTYDPSLLEFNGDLEQLSQIPTNGIFGGLYPPGVFDLNWNVSAAVTAILNGTPTNTAGKITCTGAQGVGWDYTTQALETHKFLYTPDYNVPAATYNIFTSDNGVNDNDRFNLTHSPSGGTLRLTLYDSASGLILSTTALPVFSSTQGQEYEFMITLDSSSGIVRVFIDGILFGTNTPGAWTRGAIVSKAELGASLSANNNAEGAFRDYISFSDIQETANYIPGYSINETIYVEASAIFPTYQYAGLDDVTSYTAVISYGSVNTERYSVNGFYWDGAAWVVSNGSYEQATSAVDISSNFATFPDVSNTLNLTMMFPDSNTKGSVIQTDFDFVGVGYRTSGIIQQNTNAPASFLTTFTEVLSNKPAGTSLTYILSVQCCLKWWDGAAWAESDGSLLESNTASEVQNNLSSLVLNSGGENVSILTWLSTTDNLITPEVTTVEFQYIFEIPLIQSPSITVVYGIPIDISGNVVNSAQLTVEYKGPPIPYITGSQIALVGKVQADAREEDGAVILELISSQLYGGKYLFKMSYISSVTNCRKTETWGWTEIPPQAAINFKDLIFTEEP